jgi:hypothetical protein
MDLIFFIFFRIICLNYKQGEFVMRLNNKRSKRNQNNKIVKKVIRCKALNRPVYEHEVCSKYSVKVSSNNQKNCVNCTHSF